MARKIISHDHVSVFILFAVESSSSNSFLYLSIVYMAITTVTAANTTIVPIITFVYQAVCSLKASFISIYQKMTDDDSHSQLLMTVCFLTEIEGRGSTRYFSSLSSRRASFLSSRLSFLSLDILSSFLILFVITIFLFILTPPFYFFL